MVEALVAIAVLTIGVVGPLSLLANSLNNANYAKNQITAFFLAQEGQELIINYRDNLRLDIADEGEVASADPDSPSYWLRNLGACMDDSACYIETRRHTEIERCGDGNFEENDKSEYSCPFLSTDALGFYGYNIGRGADYTIFTREINIEPVEVGGMVDEAKVTVNVLWQDKTQTRRFELNSIIYR